jgi:flagellin
MRINTNIASMNAQQISSNTNKEIGSSLEKLASGHSINKAADDASGLAIADKLRTQASSLQQGIKNANSGVAMIQMADKAMDEQSNILDTIKTKLIQAADVSTSSEGRNAIAKDINKLLTQLDNIAEQTDYNGTPLLQGTSDAVSTGGLTFQVGEGSGETIDAGGIHANTAGLNTSAAAGGSTLSELKSIEGTALTASAARASLATIDGDLTKLNEMRSELGSTQNQLESAVRNQEVIVVSLQNAESVIRDTDYAAESANFNKLNIISQAGMYAISQANAAQQNIQKLLQ